MDVGYSSALGSFYGVVRSRKPVVVKVTELDEVSYDTLYIEKFLLR